MKIKAVFAASLLLVSSPLSVAATTGADEGCIVQKNRQALAKANSEAIAEIYKTIANRDPIKSGELEKQACLPTLSKLGIDGSLALPSLSGLLNGLLNKITQYACNAMDSYIEKQVEGLSSAISDPIGITNASISITKDGSVKFGTTEGVDLEEAIEKPILDAIKNEIDGQVKNLPKPGDSLSRLNRGQSYQGLLQDNVQKELEKLHGGSRR